MIYLKIDSIIKYITIWKLKKIRIKIKSVWIINK